MPASYRRRGAGAEDPSLPSAEGGKIYKSGSTWASIRDAQRVPDCADVVAATLWVVEKSGKL
jgi:hypothetical protein